MKIYADDDPLVLNGTYDTEGYKPGERARLEKARLRQQQQEGLTTMAKRNSPSKHWKKPTKPAKPANGKRRERQVPLKGMEDVRIRALDDCAASIAEIREEMAVSRNAEGSALVRAMGLMRKHKRMTWRAHGVELVRVPGEEKLRVRTSKEKATGEVEDEEEAAGGEFEEPEEEIADDPEPGEIEAGDELRPGVDAE